MSIERVKPVFEDASASPELRNFVAMARSDGPTDAELEHLAEMLAGCQFRGRPTVERGNIQWHRNRVGTKFPCQLPSMVQIDIGENQLHALFCKGLRDAMADASAATADKSDLPA